MKKEAIKLPLFFTFSFSDKDVFCSLSSIDFTKLYIRLFIKSTMYFGPKIYLKTLIFAEIYIYKISTSVLKF